MALGDGNAGNAEAIGRSPKVTTRYDRDSDAELSFVILESVAEAAGVDPSDLDEPMYETVDPEAIGKLFSDVGTPAATPGQVVFEYCGHSVVVRSDGRISVYD